MRPNKTYTAFVDACQLVRGELREVLTTIKRWQEQDGQRHGLLVFDDESGAQVEFDLRGSIEEALERELPPTARRPGPGRPKLGVVSREVSLLPRHWEWLEQQPNGISAALRRLVDAESKREPEAGQRRRAREAASKFMWAMAGNLPQFEEASRALFRDDAEGFRALTKAWPADVRSHVERLWLGASAA